MMRRLCQKRGPMWRFGKRDRSDQGLLKCLLDGVGRCHGISLDWLGGALQARTRLNIHMLSRYIVIYDCQLQ